MHVIGDTHFGSGGVSSARSTKIARDIEESQVPPAPELVLQVGDLVQNGRESEEGPALAWIDRVCAAQAGVDYWGVVGNHDLWDDRSADEVAQAWGFTGKDYTVDLGWAKLIVLGPGVRAPDDTTIVIDQTTLNFLADELESARRKPCIVSAHAPLYNTVLGDTAEVYSSVTAGFYAVGVEYANRDNEVRDTPIRDVLADYPICKAWLCGHTHSPLDTPGLAKVETVGGHGIAHVNAGCIHYVGKTVWNHGDPLQTVYFSMVDDDLFEVRWRDHGAGIWTGPAGQRVTTLDLA